MLCPSAEVLGAGPVGAEQAPPPPVRVNHLKGRFGSRGLGRSPESAFLRLSQGALALLVQVSAGSKDRLNSALNRPSCHALAGLWLLQVPLYLTGFKHLGKPP